MVSHNAHTLVRLSPTNFPLVIPQRSANGDCWRPRIVGRSAAMHVPRKDVRHLTAVWCLRGGDCAGSANQGTLTTTASKIRLCISAVARTRSCGDNEGSGKAATEGRMTCPKKKIAMNWWRMHSAVAQNAGSGEAAAERRQQHGAGGDGHAAVRPHKPDGPGGEEGALLHRTHRGPHHAAALPQPPVVLGQAAGGSTLLAKRMQIFGGVLRRKCGLSSGGRGIERCGGEERGGG